MTKRLRDLLPPLATTTTPIDYSHPEWYPSHFEPEPRCPECGHVLDDE